MKLIVKTLANQSFDVEINSNATIEEVKKKIEEVHQYNSEGMKLIFNGQVLENNHTLNTQGINETNFLVIVGKKLGAPTNARKKKKLEEEKKPKEEIKPVEKKEEKKPEEKKPEEKKEEKKTETTTNQDFALGDEYSQIVAQFIDMGFEKPYIEQCMKAAFNNPNRAAEYLMSGIPDNIFEQVSEEQQPSQQGTQSQQPSQGQQGTTSTLETMLKQHPQFNQIKAAIQNNPDLLQPALTKIAQDDPNLMSVIQQNSQEFLRLINEPVSQTEDDGSYDGEEDDGQGEEGDHPPGTIFITQQEKQDIDSIVGMGFDRMVVVQTYFACNKDVNATVNILLEMMSSDYMMEDNSKPSGNDK